MRTSEQYLEDLRGMKPNVHMGGEIVRRDHPLIIPVINVMRLTFNPNNYDLDERKKIIKRLAGIEDQVSAGLCEISPYPGEDVR